MGNTGHVKTAYERKRNFLRGLIIVYVSLLFGALFWLSGYRCSVVLSGSMEPLLKVNDLVIIRDTSEVKAGDIIVYRQDGEQIIHRLVTVDGDTLTTKGDANTIADDPIDISAVQGKLVSFVPAVGGVVRAVKAPIDAVAAKLKIGIETSDSANVAAWVVDVQKAENTATDLTLSDPGTVSYSFTVKNYSGGSGTAQTVSEVKMRYKIEVKLPQTSSSIKLKLKLKRDGKEVSEEEVSSGGSCTFTNDSFVFAAAKKEAHAYTLEITGEADQMKNKTVLDPIQINVEAVQVK